MVRYYLKKTPGDTGSSYPLPSDAVNNKFKANLSDAVQSVTQTGFPYTFQIKASLMYFFSCL